MENLPILTKTEIEVIRLIISGMSTKEIAKHKNVRTRIVYRHIDNIARKLQVNGRMLVVAYAICSEIVPLEEARELLGNRNILSYPEPY